MRTLLAVLLLTLAPLAYPQTASEADAAVQRIEAAIKQRPDEPALYFYLADRRAELGDVSGALAALEKVIESGDGYLPARDGGFAKIWDDARFQALRKRMEAKLPRLDFAPTHFEIEDAGLIPEGIGYDAPSNSFFMGSIAEHKILRIDPAHLVKEFAGGASAGLDSILGIAVDAPRRRLYAVSTSALTSEGRKKLRNAVVAFDIDTGKLVQRYDVSAARQLNDVAVGFGGRVYTTDSAASALYELRADGSAKQLVAPGLVGGANGLAVSPDGARIYVAHSTGIAVVDASSGALTRLRNTTRENISAIDGLYEYHGELIGVQNVTSPGRVILISLSADGTEVTHVRTLLSHHHNRLDEPTTGAIRSDTGYFFLLAATGVAHYKPDGTIDHPDQVPAPTVLKILLPR